MARVRIKKNDMVTVISGAQKGQAGKVLSVDSGKGRVVVEGLNRRKRAVRRSAENPQGGIIEVECPLHVSNVMLQAKYDQRQARRKASTGAGQDEGRN